MTEQKPAKRGGFYDLNTIRQIPIVQVCQQLLNLPLEKKGNKLWCKCRDERTASTVINPDKNTFHDFGSCAGGDVITLVAYVQGVERKDAIKSLAAAFHIPSMDPREGLDANSLTDWEYEQIGLYGDKATKNFTWNFERVPIERMYELSERYGMPMNDLRKKYPKVYEKLLKQKALPYLRQLRNEYFLDVWTSYRMAKEIGNEDLFYHGLLQESMTERINQLSAAEKIFSRAAAGTSISFTPAEEYEPVKDLEKLTRGEVKPQLGAVSYLEMQDAAKKHNCSVKYRSIEYDAYLLSGLKQEFHSAFLKGNMVVVGYLEKDYTFFRQFFPKGKASVKKGLDDRIRMAEQGNKPKNPVAGKDREAER